MQLNVSFKHMDVSETVRTYTEEKSERLARYFQGKIKVSWNFSIEGNDRVAHCHLVGNGMDYFGQAETSDLRASIDLALEKLEKQLKKHKEIVTNHHHPDTAPDPGSTDLETEDNS